MSSENVDNFLQSVGMNGEQDTEKAKPTEANNPDYNRWDDVFFPNISCLLTGDVGTGKSGLAYFLLERYSKKFNMEAVTVGIPHNKWDLLKGLVRPIANIETISKMENCIVFIDEADMQLPIEDIKQRKQVCEFLSLPRQRSMILILSFHFPRLVLSRYLPYFQLLMFKRPPYLLEFAGKTKGDSLVQMMMKSEERFKELVPPEWKPDKDHMQPLSVVKNTYVIAGQVRWQGLIENPTSTFWSTDLSKIWASSNINKDESEIDGPSQSEMATSGLVDCSGKIEITDRMLARAIVYKDEAGIKTMLDPSTNVYWEIKSG